MSCTMHSSILCFMHSSCIDVSYTYNIQFPLCLYMHILITHAVFKHHDQHPCHTRYIHSNPLAMTIHIFTYLLRDRAIYQSLRTLSILHINLALLMQIHFIHLSSFTYSCIIPYYTNITFMYIYYAYITQTSFMHLCSLIITFFKHN